MKSEDGDYVELRCKSAFSFLTGAAQPEQLVQRAAELGHRALALGDSGGMYAQPRFHKAALQAGLRPIVSAEVQIEGRPLLLLCEEAAGYRNLCRLLTRDKLRSRAQGDAAAPLSFADLEAHAPGLIALTGGADGLVGAALDRGDADGARAALDRLTGIFGPQNLAVELQVHLEEQEDRRNAALFELARSFRLPLVATNDVRCASVDQLLLCDVLTCVREGVSLDGAGTRILPSGERHLKTPQAMRELFCDLPEAIHNTAAIAARCKFTLAELGYRFPDFPLPAGDSQEQFLRAIVEDAAPSRFRPYTAQARAQLDRELTLIAKLGMTGYFLIVWDIIQFCKSRGILVQGRGSAANSAVCFSLGITACDPLKMDLLFERFLSEERGEWPDIDLDLPSGSRREEVIQYLYRKYGQSGCAMTANVITYRARSAVRDVGRVLGIDPGALDRLSAQMSRFHDPAETEGETEAEEDERSELARQFEAAGLDAADPRVVRFASLWTQIQDLPRHLGQHSGGIIIAAGRLDEVVPLQPASMPGRVVIQWDKEDVADLGIVKIDLLGLGMMAALEEAVRLVPKHDGMPFDMAALPEDDPGVYDLLRRADTVGVFQVESRAQMATLPRVQPRRFYDLVVQMGLIRPGPIVGKMVHPYLRRRTGQEPVSYPHPSLEPILKRTLGIPLFQEQVMRVAMVSAGFSGGQAEQLRRAMGSRRSEAKMQAMVTQLREGMAQSGIAPAAAAEIEQAIRSFAQYGFPESHAISFAMISYASAYLKVHHPAVFYTTLLNAWPMGFYHPATLVKDAQRHGVRVRPVDVTSSDWVCTIEKTREEGPRTYTDRSERGTRAIRLGMRFVRGLRRDSALALLRARDELPFRSLADVKRRCPQLSATELQTLAEIGAFALLEGNPSRRDALWQVSELSASRGDLLDGVHEPGASPLADMSLAERIQADYRGTSITVGPHPMALVREALSLCGVQTSRQIAAAPAGRLVHTAGVVIVRQRPATAKGFFFLTLEDEHGLLNLIVAPPEFATFRSLLVGAGALAVEGALQRQNQSVSIKVTRVRAVSDLLRGMPQTALQTPVHDFH